MRNMNQQLLTTSEAAAVLGCSASTIRRLIDRGILHGFKLPGSTHRRIAAVEVEALKRGVPAKTEAQDGLGQTG
jgi:excisionase family DNA binding protein